ncbi:Protein kinase-like domain [Pseudocohnilembus persalinus]|uniref:Cyclin-dependent kinase 2 homolog n=1 Tax=Pseudocohnilembus persalinus TaxID=266149 RepID=A0A0V0QT60_PSEPJ|nr:Protein kinase-like domain [Pseudocohnilembus persalinus]|eukprot:KRX05184.1 Protein kinase-like domain [Pseudocohnilembus persalinus]
MSRSNYQVQLPKVNIERVKPQQMIAKEMNKHYILKDKLGQGTYGNVHKGFSRDEMGIGSKPYALKQFNLAQENQEKEGFPITSIREMKLLQKLDHDNILKIVEVVVQQESANILLDSEGVLKIGDFGLARSIYKPLQRALTQVVVTLFYRAPEIFLTKGLYDQKSDVWSVGCFMAELILGTQMMKSNNNSDKGQVQAIFEVCGTPNEETWPGVTKCDLWQEFKPDEEYDVDLKQRLAEILGDKLSDDGIDFLSTLLVVNPANRVSAQEALQSNYFKIDPLPCEQSELYKIAKENHDMYINSRKKMNAQDHYPLQKSQIQTSHNKKPYLKNLRKPNEQIPEPMKKIKQ